MRTLRSRPASGRRLAPGVVVLAAAISVAGCTGAGPDNAEGPPRINPEPRHDIAAAMVDGRGDLDERLNACELLDLTTKEVIDLTGAVMPEVDPTGSGDLGLLCTYGGPGSTERYDAARTGTTPGADDTDDPDDADGPGADGASTGVTTSTTTAATTATTTADETAATTTTATTTPPPFDPDIVPDTFAAGVVSPRAGAQAALAGQAALLGVRYACSEVRGPGAAEAGLTEPGAPEAPAVVRPEPDTLYIDCVAAPAGGGVEVHTILVSGDELWHITLIKPETPRSPNAEATALAALHRVADEALV